MNETEPTTSPDVPAAVPVYDPGSSLSRTGYEDAGLGVIGGRRTDQHLRAMTVPDREDTEVPYGYASVYIDPSPSTSALTPATTYVERILAERDALRERVARAEAVLAQHWDWKAGRSLHAAIRAALTPEPTP